MQTKQRADQILANIDSELIEFVAIPVDDWHEFCGAIGARGQTEVVYKGVRCRRMALDVDVFARVTYTKKNIYG